MSAVGQRGFKDFLYRFEIAAHQAADRAPIRIARNGYVGAECSFAIRHVELPSNPKERETLFKEETVAEIGRILRIRASGGEVEEWQHAFVAAI